MSVAVLWILLAITLVGLNGFFVAAEFALVKIRPTRMEQLVQEGRPFAGTAHWLWERLDRSLSACQLGITMASLGLGWVGEPAIARLLEPLMTAAGITSTALVHGVSFAIAFAVITAAHLVLGEQVPKIYAIRRPEQMALWSAAAMRGFYAFAYPLLRALDAATAFILSLLGVKPVAGHETPHSEEEIRVLLGHARSHGELSRVEHKLVEAVFEFDDTVCRQVMVPRTEVVFLDARASFADSLAIVRRTKHSRYPLCEGSLDNVIGIVHAKDLVGVGSAAELDLRSIMRPPKYVPETIRISRLLSHFQATQQHVALVVDEFGTMEGIVTLENVLEEIVGPVRDEFDIETPDIVPAGENRWLLDGGTPVADLAELLDTELREEGVDTVAGLVALRLGRIPSVGDVLDLGVGSLEVVDVSHNHATRIRLARPAEQPDPEE